MKYVIANIKVPIGFNDDQSIKTFMERISIDFVSCTELPPIPPENEFKNDKFLKNLKEFFQKSTNLQIHLKKDQLQYGHLELLHHLLIQRFGHLFVGVVLLVV